MNREEIAEVVQAEFYASAGRGMPASLATKIADALLARLRPAFERMEQKEAAREGLDWCLDEVRDALATLGCSHGHNHSKTPPMMYREWIGCVLAHHTATLRASLARKDEALRMAIPILNAARDVVIRAERLGAPVGSAIQDLLEIATTCRAALARAQESGT